MKKILLVLLICVAINAGEKLFNAGNSMISSLASHIAAGNLTNCLNQCTGTSALTELQVIGSVMNARQ